MDPRDEILLAAGRLFAEHGYERTTTGDIAEEVGLTQPAIFYHFDSKEQLFHELANTTVDEPLAELEAIAATEASPAAQLHRQIVFHVVHDLTSPFPMAAIVDDALRLSRDGGLEELIDKSARYANGVRQMIRDGIAVDQFRDVNEFTAAMAVLGMCNWALRWYRPSETLTAQRLGEDFADFSVVALLVKPRTLSKVIRESQALVGIREAGTAARETA
ncbi:MAG TPA: TetR/AcrR family transcriptional regulator [Nitriliruptorales bacterium]